MTAEPRATSWIVTCRSSKDLEAALAAVEGARFLRALDARRAVVLAPRTSRARLAALPGVSGVEEDTLRHLHGWPSG